MTLYVDGVDVSTAKDVRVDGVQAKAVYVDGVRVWSPPAALPVVVDAVGAGSTSGPWSHTVAGNTLLVFVSTVNFGGGRAPVSVDADGVDLDLLAVRDYGSGGITLFVFGKIGVTPGLTTITVTTTLNAGSAWCGGSVSYSNVGSFGTPVAANAAASPAVVSATVPTDGMGFCALAAVTSGAFGTFNQTPRGTVTRIRPPGFSSSYLNFLMGDSGPGNIVYQAPVTGSVTGWGGIVVPLKPA